jgi:hypothetical protein
MGVRSGDTLLRQAALKVCKEFLGVKPGDEILLVFDRVNDDLAEAFDIALHDHGAPACATKIQFGRQLTESVSHRFKKCLQESSVVISALANVDESASFRMHFLEQARHGNARVLHMPGSLRPERFVQLVEDSDWESMEAMGQSIAHTLRQTKEIGITTNDGRKGSADKTLYLNLCDNRVFVSCGTAHPGVVSNFPTGTVFTVPAIGSATGELVLNGAAGDLAFENESAGLLRFDGGDFDLGRSEFADTPKAKSLARRLDEAVDRTACAKTVSLFIVGLNKSIGPLRGHPAEDSKAWGTVSIAIGGNEPYYGDVMCAYQKLLISFPKDVCFDGTSISGLWGNSA